MAKNRSRWFWHGKTKKTKRKVRHGKRRSTHKHMTRHGKRRITHKHSIRHVAKKHARRPSRRWHEKRRIKHKHIFRHAAKKHARKPRIWHERLKIKKHKIQVHKTKYAAEKPIKKIEKKTEHKAGPEASTKVKEEKVSRRRFSPFSGIDNFILKRKVENLESMTGKRLERMDESFSLVKNMLIELRKENEELRRDRQFLLDRMKTMIMDNERQKMEAQAAEIALESEKYTKMEQKEPEENDHVKEEPPQAEIVGKKEKPGKEARKEGGEEVQEEETRHIDRRVETPLDELLEFIMKKGSVKTSEAAKLFKVKEKQVEEWARILEEHELIEIHYPTIGKPLLKKKY